MSFKIIISNELKKSLAILKRKDKTTYIAVENKIFQIASCDQASIERFKKSQRKFESSQTGSYWQLRTYF